MSKQEVTISSIYNNKLRVLYYFQLTLFCRKSRPFFGGRRAIPIACGGRSTIGVVVAFRLVTLYYPDNDGRDQLVQNKLGGSISPRRNAPSGCELGRLPSDMEGSCEFL